MLRFAADENFSGRIVRGLTRRIPDLDLVRIQVSDVAGCDDRRLLEWTAAGGRILLTHDVASISAAAIARVAAGQGMPGVVEVRQDAPMGRVIDDLVLLAAVAEPSDLEGQILYLPF